MKILIATECYIYNVGGITAAVLALCAGLRRRGHEVRTLSLSNTGRSFQDGEDYFIRSVPALYYPDMRMSFAAGDPLIKELEAWLPDVVHVQTEGSAYRLAYRIAKRCGVPLVMTCHTDYGYFLFGKNRDLLPVKAPMRLAGRILYWHAVKVTVPSRKAADFPFLSSVRDRLTVIPNGMELEKKRKRFPAQEREDFRASLGIGGHTGTLVTVSRLSKEKNVRELISFLPGLLEKAPDAKLLIVGDGPDRAHLEKLADKLYLRGNIVFTGRVPAGDVWKYLVSGDVFVSASVFEVHSMSYLEALASGLPMLCRADEALDGVLEHGENGFAYHTGEEFAAYAARLLRDDALRSSMALRSERKAESFSSDVFASSMIRVYEEAIRDHMKGKV